MPDSTVVEANIRPRPGLLAVTVPAGWAMLGMLLYEKNKDDEKRNDTLKVRSMDPLPICTC